MSDGAIILKKNNCKLWDLSSHCLYLLQHREKKTCQMAFCQWNTLSGEMWFMSYFFKKKIIFEIMFLIAPQTVYVFNHWSKWIRSIFLFYSFILLGELEYIHHHWDQNVTEIVPEKYMMMIIMMLSIKINSIKLYSACTNAKQHQTRH